jgi:hypothetical protein
VPPFAEVPPLLVLPPVALFSPPEPPSSPVPAEPAVAPLFAAIVVLELVQATGDSSAAKQAQAPNLEVRKDSIEVRFSSRRSRRWRGP